MEHELLSRPDHFHVTISSHHSHRINFSARRKASPCTTATQHCMPSSLTAEKDIFRLRSNPIQLVSVMEAFNVMFLWMMEFHVCVGVMGSSTRGCSGEAELWEMKFYFCDIILWMEGTHAHTPRSISHPKHQHLKAINHCSALTWNNIHSFTFVLSLAPSRGPFADRPPAKAQNGLLFIYYRKCMSGREFHGAGGEIGKRCMSN